MTSTSTTAPKPPVPAILLYAAKHGTDAEKAWANDFVTRQYDAFATRLIDEITDGAPAEEAFHRIVADFNTAGQQYLGSDGLGDSIGTLVADTLLDLIS